MDSFELSLEFARLETRYQDMAAEYYHAQAAFQEAKRENEYLASVLRAKQQAITLLLAHYPHAITTGLHGLLTAA